MERVNESVCDRLYDDNWLRVVAQFFAMRIVPGIILKQYSANLIQLSFRSSLSSNVSMCGSQ